MGTERSDRIFGEWHQSSEKFDYFITAITCALCAYISQTFQAEQISISPNTLELVSLLTLIASVYAGFKRIESTVATQRHNHSSVNISEQLGQLITKYNGGHLINEATGEVYSPALVEMRVKALKEIQPDVEATVSKAANSADSWYKWRNRFLSVGFLMLIASKIWVAYL